MDFLLKGLVLGFSIAAPVGPIGILCIRRTLSEGRSAGLVTGLGAATADAIYGSIAAFGLTAVSTFLLAYAKPLQIAGALFLFYLAAKIFFADPAKELTAAEPHTGLAAAYFSSLFLTLTNPATIISFIAVFAVLGLVAAETSFGLAGMMVLGVFLGSAAWWLILSGGIHLFKSKFSSSGLVWVNRISGLLMAILGLVALGILDILRP